MEKFSIITATVLRPSLRRTCDSLQQQRHRNWQHILMVDKPKADLSDDERSLIAEIADPRREIHYCDVAHCDFGNSCRWNAWDHVTGTYAMYLDDDDYYLGDAFDVLQQAIAERQSPPTWGVFPVDRFGERFFNLPPGQNVTCSNQFFYRPSVDGRQLRYPKAGYRADGELIDFLRDHYPFAVVDPGYSLAAVDASNFGIRVPIDRQYVEAAFVEYVTDYSTERHALSMATSQYIWNALNSFKLNTAADVGSGWSSFILRLYKKLAQPDLVVRSLDSDPRWLDMTERFLAKHGLDTSGLELGDSPPEESVDFIIHDIAKPDDGETVARLMRRNYRVLLFGDLSDDACRSRVEAEAANYGLSIRTLDPGTGDPFGRRPSVITR